MSVSSASPNQEKSDTRSQFNTPDVKDLIHVPVRSGCRLVRTAAVLARGKVRRIPVPPMVLVVCLLVVAMVLRSLVEKLCKCRDVRSCCRRRCPFATGKPRLDLLEQPPVAVRVLERSKREVGTIFRVAPADA